MRNASKWDEADLGSTLHAVTATLASVGVGVVTDANAPIFCDASQVALIDEIAFSCKTADGASNRTINLQVNGRTSGVHGATSSADPIQLPFHFPGDTNIVRTEHYTIRPRGRLVVHPSSTLWVNASDPGCANVHIRYRKKNLLAAIRDGDISPNGSLPQVASSNGDDTGLAGSVSKKIIDVGADEAIEILGLYLTGHNFQAAATDEFWLGFWDGATGGDFPTGGKFVFKAFTRGLSSRFGTRLLLDNVDRCIAGALDWDFYVEATANLAGATPKMDCNLIYRKVKVPEVSSTDGEAAQTPASRTKWWCFTNTDPTLGGGNEYVKFFNASFATELGNVATIAKIKGHAGSVVCAAGAGDAVLAIGIDPGNIASVDPVVVGDDGNAGSVTSTWGRDGIAHPVTMLRQPGFVAVDITNVIVARAQLAWGTFGSRAESSTNPSVIA